MCGLRFEPFEDLRTGSTQNVVDAVNLIELILAGEEGFFGDELKQDAAETPDVHFLVVVAVGHQALGGSVPTSRDVIGVGSRG